MSFKWRATANCKLGNIIQYVYSAKGCVFLSFCHIRKDLIPQVNAELIAVYHNMRY